MSALTRLSLRNRALIALITVVAAVFGVVAMTGARQELMPDVERPIVVGQSTEAGVAPDVVDTQISTPIETAVQSVEGIESTSSTSTTGSSTVTVEFAFGTDRVRRSAASPRSCRTGSTPSSPAAPPRTCPW